MFDQVNRGRKLRDRITIIIFDNVAVTEVLYLVDHRL